MPDTMWPAKKILEVLDACCDAYTFPMLDNGYVFPAAARLSLHRSADDWAVVIEVFGFSPRAGLPDVGIHTFGSRLHDRDKPSSYVSQEAYEGYLKSNPHNELRCLHPVGNGPWQDAEDDELVAADASEVSVRGNTIQIPPLGMFADHGIDLEQPPRIRTVELCRVLAATHRDEILATAAERRISVPPDVPEILVLDEWRHPDVVDEDARPASDETFQQLAEVLITGDVARYCPASAPNTHWANWPDGGSL